MSGTNYSGTIFDDEANTSITAGTAPFTGRFRPMNPLNSYDFEQVKGTWTLEINDRVKANRGTLVSWSLEIMRGVGPGGLPPVAVDDVVQMTAGTASVNIAALANDSDPEGGTLSIDSFTQPDAGKGTVSLNLDGTFKYTPPSSTFTGTVTFTYTIVDIDGNMSTATVTINVVSGGGGGGKGGGKK